MAVNREPVLKRCKALGISPTIMGVSKQTKRNPNANKRQKISEYGMQLKEKQKLKFIYGVLEKQFYHYFEIATKMEGKAGENLITCLESRVDNIIFRMGMAATRREARQLAGHGHFNINGQRVNIPSYRVKEGDVVSLRDGSKSSVKFKEMADSTNGRLTPAWLDMDKENASAKIIRMPKKEDLDYEIEEQLIVELYSK